jgi:nitrile hydratase
MAGKDDHHHDHGHHHGHDHEFSELSDTQLRVRALETILSEKGYVDPAALDLIVEAYETKIGPHTGARIIAKAWADPDFHHRLVTDAPKAVAALGITENADAEIMVLENTPKVHNVIVCTLCSCYPTSILGLPPVWYKSAPYRSRTVSEPRSVLREMGVELPADTEVRVWDSTSEMRYIVIPLRPPGTEGWSEERLAKLVTRDCMIGTGMPKNPKEVPA